MGLVADGDVDRSVRDSAQGARSFRRTDLDLWKAVAILDEIGAQVAGRERRIESDRNAASFPATDGPGAAYHDLKVFENAADAEDKLATGQRRTYAAIGSFKQPNARLVLESSNVAAEIGLLYREALSSFAEATLTFRCFGVAQMFELNRH